MPEDPSSRMPEHPSEATLRRFARGEAGREEGREVLTHLFRRCPRCSALMLRVAPFLVPADRSNAPDPQLYEETVARSVNQVIEEARNRARLRPLAPKAVAALLGKPWPRKRLLVKNRPSLQGQTGWEALIEGAVRLRDKDPRQAADLCLLALERAQEMEEEGLPPELAADYQALAAAELANAQRICNRPEKATRAMTLALLLLYVGSGDLATAARVWDLAASLFRHQRQLDLASHLLARVHDTYLRLGDTHLAGRVLVKQAMTKHRQGDLLSAVQLVGKACRLLVPAREPELSLVAVHNFLWYSVELGDYQTADELLRLARPLYDEFPEPLRKLRLLWLEGRIAVAQGRCSEGEAKLLEAKTGFTQAGIPYDAALVALDLARLLGREGRVLEVRLLVKEMITVFQRLKVGREALAALLTLREALGRRRVPLTLLEQVADFLKRHREDPELRFPARPGPPTPPPRKPRP